MLNKSSAFYSIWQFNLYFGCWDSNNSFSWFQPTPSISVLLAINNETSLPETAIAASNASSIHFYFACCPALVWTCNVANHYDCNSKITWFHLRVLRPFLSKFAVDCNLVPAYSVHCCPAFVWDNNVAHHLPLFRDFVPETTTTGGLVPV